MKKHAFAAFRSFLFTAIAIGLYYLIASIYGFELSRAVLIPLGITALWVSFYSQIERNGMGRDKERAGPHSRN